MMRVEKDDPETTRGCQRKAANELCEEEERVRRKLVSMATSASKPNVTKETKNSSEG